MVLILDNFIKRFQAADFIKKLVAAREFCK